MTPARLLRGPIGWAMLLILLVLAAASVFTTVGETQQAVIVRGGVPRAVVNLYRPDQRFGETGAGLIAHMPLLDQVFFVDRRAQTLELDGQPVSSSDGGTMGVDADARYRVVDPALFYTATHGDARIFDETLKPVLGTALRTSLGALPTAQLLVPERVPELRDVRDRLDQASRRFGVRVSEVRLSRIDLPDGAALDNAIGRMRVDREQRADAIRAEGAANVARIRATGEAQAAKLFADAFGQDPEFYDFYRAMQSYQITLADGQTQMILSPNSEYFRQFRTGGKP